MKNFDVKFRRKCNLGPFGSLCIFLAAIFLTSPLPVPAQERNFEGIVKTAAGDPVVGATIIVTGTQTGTSSDLSGNFSLNLKQPLPANATLTVSYIGYKTQTVTPGAKTFLEITLEEESALLDDVVVVGYGTARKKDLTGSLSSVNSQQIIARQQPTISSALQGAMPGVTITRTHSAPGEEATIRVRGITSMTDGASDPYVLIDGVPGSISDVNPNDVASITVLKDAASASIYGSQAAAGVILITTKRGGEGTTSVTYNYSLGLDYPTTLPDYTDAIGYMEAVNELRYNDTPSGGWYQEYPRETIENYWQLNRENPDLYPNVNWLDLLLKKHAVRQSHTLSVRSGNSKRSTALSIGYDDIDGLFTKNLTWKRYTVRLNNDVRIFKWMHAAADISLRKTDELDPATSPSNQMRYIPPIYAAVWSNGHYAPGKDSNNKYAALMDGGTKNRHSYYGSARFQLDVTPLEGLTVTGIFAPKFTYRKNKNFTTQVPYWSSPDDLSSTSSNYISDATVTELTEQRNDTFSHTTQFYANYQKTFGQNHNFSAMIGYENYWYEEEGLQASNSSFPHSLIPYLSAGGTDAVTAESNNVYELALRSYFGRVMYNYANKYYVQGNIRRDGSSRFAPDHRWGTFLSASAGWVFTQEKFLAGAKNWLDFGKLRVSYGQLGNERIQGYYPYQATLTPAYGVGYVGNNVTAIPGYSQTAAVISDLTWETTTTYDIGLDLTMFRNRLTLTGDYYYKRTDDMLLTVPIAPIIGLTDPYDNVGTMNTRGWELTLGWRDRIGELEYSVSFNISDDVSTMGYIGNREIISNGKIIREGVEYNSWYGFVSNGLFQTQDELNGAAKYGNEQIGDIRYKNLADADPESPLINNEYDRTVLGSSLPHFNYGGNISLAWKGIDFSLDFQGVGKRNSYLSTAMVQPLRSQWYNIPEIIVGNSWSRKNTIEQNMKARYPRYSWNSNDSNYAYSDFWLFDGSYFRVKNITLGYSLPEKWMKKVWIKNLRFAATLTDFFTISHFPKGWDPEGGVTSYPITKSVIFSASITF